MYVNFIYMKLTKIMEVISELNMYYYKSLFLSLCVCFKSHFSVLLQNIEKRRKHFDSKTFLNRITYEHQCNAFLSNICKLVLCI